MSLPHILAISGSLRQGSYNTAILRTIAERFNARARFTVQTLNELPVYDEDLDADAPASVVALRAEMRMCDAIIISTPEYNHGASGAVFNALDWASRPYGQSAFKGKPALVMSASPATTGGARAHTHLYPALLANECKLVGGPQVCVAGAKDKIEDGLLKDEATLDFIGQALDRLIALLQA